MLVANRSSGGKRPDCSNTRRAHQNSDDSTRRKGCRRSHTDSSNDWVDGAYWSQLNTHLADFAGWVRRGGYLTFRGEKNNSPDEEIVAPELLSCGQYREIRRLDRLVILQKTLAGVSG